MFRYLPFLLTIGFGSVCGDSQAFGDSDAIRSSSQWFEIQSFQGGPSADQVLELCEVLRAELFRVWGGVDNSLKWEPRCKIQLHQTRTSYMQKVGSNGGQTSGCSLIRMDSGKIVCREIDLLLNQLGELPALPHELTHIVLADKFRGRQPPHWIDEGIAMLADTVAKQNLHGRDCHEAIMSGNAMSVYQIVTLDSFSSPGQMPAFYGQSLSLVRMLAERASPEKIVEFANDSLDRGMEVALKHHYSLGSIDELEKAWRNYVFGKSTSEIQVAVVSVSFKP